MKKQLLAFVVGLSATSLMYANDYTFVFDGDNELGGLTRQTSNKEADLTFTDSFTLSESGINFKIEKTGGTGKGYALVNAGGDNAGVYVSSKVDTKLSLTVPGGKISGVKLNISGYALNTLEISFNGKEVGTNGELSVRPWIWTNSEGVETVEMTWPLTYGSRYIHSIEVTYTANLGGKEDSGLAFAETSVTSVLGKEYTAPALSNPHGLPLKWESSDPKVAEVGEDGKVTLVGPGKTFISVSTEGNDKYAAGNARYELTVIGMAANIPQLMEYAPEKGQQVIVDFPMTVTFPSRSYAFVTDPEGNATLIENIKNNDNTSTTVATIYKVGDVIPAGWTASNLSANSSALWQGLPEEVTKTVEVEYPKVDSVDKEDTDKVVILCNVSFTSSTASGMTKAYGTTPDGKRYEFQDTYDAPVMDPGTYDVTCVVRYSVYGSTTYFFLAPIAYTESDPSGIKEIGLNKSETRYFNLNGVETESPADGIFIRVSDGKAEVVKR